MSEKLLQHWHSGQWESVKETILSATRNHNLGQRRDSRVAEAALTDVLPVVFIRSHWPTGLAVRSVKGGWVRECQLTSKLIKNCMCSVQRGRIVSIVTCWRRVRHTGTLKNFTYLSKKTTKKKNTLTSTSIHDCYKVTYLSVTKLKIKESQEVAALELSAAKHKVLICWFVCLFFYQSSLQNSILRKTIENWIWHRLNQDYYYFQILYDWKKAQTEVTWLEPKLQ